MRTSIYCYTEQNRIKALARARIRSIDKSSSLAALYPLRTRPTEPPNWPMSLRTMIYRLCTLLAQEPTACRPPTSRDCMHINGMVEQIISPQTLAVHLPPRRNLSLEELRPCAADLAASHRVVPALLERPRKTNLPKVG